MEFVTVDENDSSKLLKIGTHLKPYFKTQLVGFLHHNLDVFTWTHFDMTGIFPKIACHTLNVDPTKDPVKQKKRSMRAECSTALNKEVNNLLDNGFIREAVYPEWTANPVLVKKPNGKWRTCIDFSNHNDACPKDCFPLLRIDQLVDGTAGHELLSFMDAYSGYNQIPMHIHDQDHTTSLLILACISIKSCHSDSKTPEPLTNVWSTKCLLSKSDGLWKYMWMTC